MTTFEALAFADTFLLVSNKNDVQWDGRRHWNDFEGTRGKQKGPPNKSPRLSQKAAVHGAVCHLVQCCYSRPIQRRRSCCWNNSHVMLHVKPRIKTGRWDLKNDK